MLSVAAVLSRSASVSIESTCCVTFRSHTRQRSTKSKYLLGNPVDCIWYCFFICLLSPSIKSWQVIFHTVNTSSRSNCLNSSHTIVTLFGSDIKIAYLIYVTSRSIGLLSAMCFLALLDHVGVNYCIIYIIISWTIQFYIDFETFKRPINEYSYSFIQFI